MLQRAQFSRGLRNDINIDIDIDIDIDMYPWVVPVVPPGEGPLGDPWGPQGPPNNSPTAPERNQITKKGARTPRNSNIVIASLQNRMSCYEGAMGCLSGAIPRITIVKRLLGASRTTVVPLTQLIPPIPRKSLSPPPRPLQSS